MRNSFHVSAAGKKGGFTLVEILVALGIFMMLGLFVVEIIRNTGRTIKLSNQAVDAASQARLAFDRIGLDLAHLVRRPDADFEAVPAGADTLLTFLSSVTSPLSTGNRGLSLISYQMSAIAANKGSDGRPRTCLVRAGMAVRQTDSGFFGLDAQGLPILFSDPLFPASLHAQTGDFDALAPGIVRTAIGFQLRPDNAQALLQDGTTIANAQGQIVYSPPVHTLTSTDGTATRSLVDLGRINAIVVGVVTVDQQNLALLTDTHVQALTGAFPPLTTAQNLNHTPSQAWIPVAEGQASLPASVPLPARQALRVFERFYPLAP